MSNTYQFEHFSVLLDESGKPRVLGEGGMGITYKARDTRLGKTVALKMIRAGIGDVDVAKARFSREAKLAAQLHHPSIVPIYHFGDVGGQLFYAMEFCDGPTVEQLIANRTQSGLGPLPVQSALTFCAQIASALAEAERLGLTHRDVKPSNIIVLKQADGEELAKLIDFGLAKSVLAASGGTAHVTVTEARGFTGSFRFASPEQLQELDMDIRSDFYSLGATLWFMLFAKPPFPGESPALVITRVLRDPLPRGDLDRLPPSVAHLLERMLAKSGAERPQTALALKNEIRECLNKLGNLAPTEVPYSGAGNLKILVKAKGVQDSSAVVTSAKVADATPPKKLIRPEWLAGYGSLVQKLPQRVRHPATPLAALGVLALVLVLAFSMASRPKPIVIQPTPAVKVASNHAPNRATSPAPVVHTRELEPPKTVESADELRKRLKEALATDPATAADLLRKAAESGDINAQKEMGDFYANEQSESKDWKAALDWYTKAAEGGNVAAQRILGKAYLKGADLPKDNDAGYRWSRKAADQGNSEAAYNVGLCYENGWGVEVNLAEAVQWYEKAAAAGNTSAQEHLAQCYQFGKGVEKDETKAATWLTKAAEHDLASSQFLLGVRYEKGNGVPQDMAKALDWFKRSAEAGFAQAENELGYFYETGQGVPADRTKAFEYYEKSATKGCAVAEANLGDFYFYGKSGKKDAEKAFVLYQQASTQGEPKGDDGLGLCYFKGLGVAKNYPQAFELFQKAAARGLNETAAAHLAMCYSEGKGVATDMNQAVLWSQKAAAAGNVDSQKWLKARKKSW